MSFLPDITEARVKALIKSELKIQQDFGNDESMFNIGATNKQLQDIQRRFSKVFNKTVATIFFNDTVRDITARLNNKTIVPY